MLVVVSRGSSPPAPLAGWSFRILPLWRCKSYQNIPRFIPTKPRTIFLVESIQASGSPSSTLYSLPDRALRTIEVHAKLPTAQPDRVLAIAFHSHARNGQFPSFHVKLVPPHTRSRTAAASVLRSRSGSALEGRGQLTRQRGGAFRERRGVDTLPPPIEPAPRRSVDFQSRGESTVSPNTVLDCPRGLRTPCPNVAVVTAAVPRLVHTAFIAPSYCYTIAM